MVSHAGAVLLVDTARAAGLDRALSVALGGWRKPTAVHDPAKIVLDLAVSLALGGDCWLTSPSCAPPPRSSGGSRRTRRSRG